MGAESSIPVGDLNDDELQQPASPSGRGKGRGKGKGKFKGRGRGRGESPTPTTPSGAARQRLTTTPRAGSAVGSAESAASPASPPQDGEAPAGQRFSMDHLQRVDQGLLSIRLAHLSGLPTLKVEDMPASLEADAKAGPKIETDIASGGSPQSGGSPASGATTARHRGSARGSDATSPGSNAQTFASRLTGGVGGLLAFGSRTQSGLGQGDDASESSDSTELESFEDTGWSHSGYKGDRDSNGARHGDGVQKFADGRRYSGQFFNDMSQGYGKMEWPDGSSYVGQYVRSRKHGEGRFSWGDFRYYDGQWVNGERSGQGYSVDKEAYMGEYIHGRRHGDGVLLWTDGRRYAGQFVHGHLTGQAVMCWPDGRRYIGAYKNNKKEGHGLLLWPDGRIYDGQWRDGKRHGAGITVDSKGRRLEQMWAEDAPLPEKEEEPAAAEPESPKQPGNEKASRKHREKNGSRAGSRRGSAGGSQESRRDLSPSASPNSPPRSGQRESRRPVGPTSAQRVQRSSNLASFMVAPQERPIGGQEPPMPTLMPDSQSSMPKKKKKKKKARRISSSSPGPQSGSLADLHSNPASITSQGKRRADGAGPQLGAGAGLHSNSGSWEALDRLAPESGGPRRNRWEKRSASGSSQESFGERALSSEGEHLDTLAELREPRSVVQPISRRIDLIPEATQESTTTVTTQEKRPSWTAQDNFLTPREADEDEAPGSAFGGGIAESQDDLGDVTASRGGGPIRQRLRQTPSSKLEPK
mmetsp:Transcript_52129/g.124164  ORF Transcript_52129/g.124164 Transcript_52129/m.124164 type:complete len:754 (-) Transcript_52129:86-2347(-)